MSITEKTIVVFDPVKDYRIMTSWMSMNDMTEWKRHDSTVAIAFERVQTTFFEAEEGETHEID